MNRTKRSVLAPRPLSALLAVALAAAQVAVAVPALAQQPQGQPAAANPDNAKKAFEVFKKAQVPYKANKFAEALPLFRESFALQPSPNSQVYIARCLAGMGDNIAAYNEYTAIIADVDQRNDPKYAGAKDSAVTERDEVAGKIALLTVTVTGPTAQTFLSVGGHDVPRESWGKPIPLAPGGVDVAVTTLPGGPKAQHLELAAGEKKQISIDAVAQTTTVPENPPPGAGNSRKVLRPVAYLAGGVGVAGFLVFGIAGGLASASFSDLDSKCTKGTAGRVCPSNLQGTIDSGKAEQTAANVGLVIGAVGLAAGVTLFVLSREPKKEAAPQPEVHAVVGPSYVGMQGTF